MADMSSDNNTALSVWQDTEAMDDFPVLKAFQQYIDAEQDKARRKITMLCVIFGSVLVSLITIFVVIIVFVNARNQALNDRLMEFAMMERNRQVPMQSVQPPAATVVTPAVTVPQQPDNSAILAIAAKLDELQRRMNENQVLTEKAAKEAAERAVKLQPATQSPSQQNPQATPTSESIEIMRLKALLETEREKTALAKERQKQLELEAYRRTHYPELYAPRERKDKPTKVRASDAEFNDLLKDVDEAISYFDDEEKSEGKAPSASKEHSAPAGDAGGWNIPNK